MNAHMTKVLAKTLLAGVALCLLQGCAAGYPGSAPHGVAEAYETSGAVSVNPYTRTIFSSTNF